MDHPFNILASEYEHIWFNAKPLLSREAEIDRVAQKILDTTHFSAFSATYDKTGVPVLWHGPVLFRESDLDLDTYLGNGDPLHKPTVDVPRGRGPFVTYELGAEDSLRYDHVAEVTIWSIERMLYEWELWNGFGYRNKGIISPYLVGGTDLQLAGKYVADGRWDPHHMDTQLGCVPIAKRLLELRADLELPTISLPTNAPTVPAVAPEGLGGEHDTAWIQGSLNKLGATPDLDVDGSYGRRTRNAVIDFQRDHGLEVDGLAGPITIETISAALATLKTPSATV